MDKKYIAFISYRHVPRDAAVAQTIHRQIERYDIPRKLRRNGKRFGTVFRDKEEMAVSSDLSQKLKDALDQSEYLIVVCSPDTAASRWVGEEIAYFLKHHQPDQIFTVLAKGEAEDVIPDILKYRKDPKSGEPVRVIPLAVDACGKTIRASCRKLRRNMPRLYAGMLGCSYGELVMRSQRRKLIQILTFFSAVLLVALGFTVALLNKNQEIARQNQEIEKQNQALEEKTQELARQKEELQLRESKLLTQDALDALAAGDRYTAIANAVSALPSAEDERPYYAPAEQALIAAMGYLEDAQISFISTHNTIVSEMQISDYCIADNGRKIVVVDNYGVVSCRDSQTGEQLWKNSYEKEQWYYQPTILSCDAVGCVIVSLSRNYIVAFSVETGEELWSSSSYGQSEGRPLVSADQRMLVFAVTTGHFLAVSTETGNILQKIDLSEAVESYFGSDWQFAYEMSWYVGEDTAAALSGDNSLYVGCFVAEKEDDSELALCYYAVDLKNGIGKIVYSRPLQTRNLEPVYVSISDNKRKLAAVQTSHRDTGLPHYAEMIDLESCTRMWRTDLPLTENADARCDLGEAYHQLMGDNLLIGYENVLHLLDAETGRIKATLSFDDNIALLSSVDERTYRVVLNNGDYLVSQITDTGIPSPLLDFASEVSIDNLEYGRILYQDAVLNGAAAEITVDADGRATLAVVARDNIYQIEVFHLLPFGGFTDRYEVDFLNFNYSAEEGEILKDDFVCQKYLEKLDSAEAVMNKLGRNGLFVSAFRTNEPMPRDEFIVHDTLSGTCTTIVDEGIWYVNSVNDLDVKFFVGNIQPVFASIDEKNVLRIYNGVSGEKLCESSLNLALSSIVDMGFILNDAYALIRTIEGRIIICDAATGDIVCREHGFSYYASRQSLIYEDPQNHRLYIVGYKEDLYFGDDYSNEIIYHGICLDTRTWMKMAEIPGMIAFDERENMIYRYLYGSGMEHDKIIAYRIPGTQELVELAQSFIQQN